MKTNEFHIGRCKPVPAIAYENGRGYWKNIKGNVVGIETNITYGGFRYIFKYEGELVNHVGVVQRDYENKEMYISPENVKFLDGRAELI